MGYVPLRILSTLWVSGPGLRARKPAESRQWLIQELRGTGAQVEEDPFVASTPIGPIPMTNLIAKFRGSTSRDGDRGRPLRHKTFRRIPFPGRQ